jgi:hypothetical protein
MTQDIISVTPLRETHPPTSWRLARRNGELILQAGSFWAQGQESGIEWNDVPTVDLDGLDGTSDPAPVPKPPVDEGLIEGLTLISDGMSAVGHESDSWFVARAADLLQQLSAPAPVVVPVAVSDALIKMECALSDIAEGEETDEAPNTLEWAEKHCAETLAIIRPVMRQHGIRTSEWPPATPPEAQP